MTVNKVLVAYASKHGSTAETAREIAAALNAAGIQSEALPAKEIKDISGYQAVIIGSAIYMEGWLKEAAEFVKKFQEQLPLRPVWLFQAGPLDTTAETAAKPLDKKIARLASAIKIRGYTTFGGKLTRECPGLAEKLLARRGMEGDFRNFEQVKSWAQAIAKELKNP